MMQCVDHTPSAPFVGTIDTNFSVVDGYTLWRAHIDPPVLVITRILLRAEGKEKAILPALNHC